jgi:hypothetical protein
MRHPIVTARANACVGWSLMVRDAVTAAWFAPVRGTVSAAPWKPTLAEVPAPTVILHT